MPLSQLNAEQQTAATTSFGANLVIASAGTGKTSTIVARIAHLLNSGVNADEILLLTFTNKAALEMIARVSKIFGKQKAHKIRSGTFHSVSYQILKEQNKKIQLKRPTELRVLFKSVYNEHNQKLSLEHQSLLAYYELWQNLNDDDFVSWLGLKNARHLNFGDVYTKIISDYENLKQELGGFVGFNDLLVLFKNELNNGLDLGIKEVLVDEYQDTNALQNQLINAFKAKSLFCVGDYDQSIYGFNGSAISIISGFKDAYKNAQIFTLDKNYRSTKPIIMLANKVIKNNERIYPKNLSVVRTDVYSNPSLLEYDELFSQYEDIAKRIENSKFKHEDIAVIFRNNSTTDGIEAMLRKRAIKCKRKDTNSFFENKEIKFVLDLVSLFEHPQDLLAFIGVCQYIKGVAGSKTKEIYNKLLHINPKGVIAALCHETKADLFGNCGFNHRLFELVSLKEDAVIFFEHFSNLAKTTPKTAYDLIEKIENSKLFELVKNALIKERMVKNHKTQDDKLQELDQKIQAKIATLKEFSKPFSSLQGFINAVNFNSSELESGKGVNLLSVHSSKGLEFEEVFVVDLMQGRFPNTKLMATSGSLEEERRLFYVAVTRAKQSLFLSYAKYDKIKRKTYEKSIFLKEAGF